MPSRWEDPAEGALQGRELTPEERHELRELEESYRLLTEGYDGQGKTREQEERDSMWVIAYLLGAVALVVVVVVVALAWAWWPSGGAGALDCGPEGKPALGGTACIDKQPAYVVVRG